MSNIDDAMDEVLGQSVGDLMRVPFYCVHCGEEHPGGEPAFRFPDRLFGLDIAPEQRELLAETCDEDTFELGGLHFVRGVLQLPVHDGTAFCLGLWVQLDYQGAPLGRIANQSDFFGPTLGVRVSLEARAPGWRPHIIAIDDAHALTRAQHEGIDRNRVVCWMSDEFHANEARPGLEPFVPTLATHGWELLPASDGDKAPVSFDQPPAQRDTVKVIIRFLGADASGAPTPITAGWWLRIWDTTRPDVWGATLASIPRVPSTLMFGSPVWVRREHIFQHALAED